MPIRKTPIERLAAGESLDRQARYMASRRAVGLVRVSLWVPMGREDELRSIAAGMVSELCGDADDD